MHSKSVRKEILFSRSRLNEFTLWLVRQGWHVEKPKGVYEIFRARKTGRQDLLLIYDKDPYKKKLFVYEDNVDVLREFLKETEKEETWRFSTTRPQ